MPRIRTYDSNVQLGVGGVPAGPSGPVADNSLFSSAAYVSQQVEKFGKGISSVATDMANANRIERAKYLKSSVRKMESEDADWWRATYAEQVQTYKGGEAVKGPDGLSIDERMDKLSKERFAARTSEMQDPDQKDMYTMTHESQRKQFLTQALNYRMQQNEVFEKATLEGAIEQNVQAIIYGKGDDKVIAAQIGQLEQNVKALHKGMPKEYVDVQVQNAKDKAYSAVIAQYLDEHKPEDGWAFFNANKDAMSDPVKADMKLKLEKGSLEVQADLIARQINADRLSGKLTEAEALEQAGSVERDATYDPDLRKRTKEILKGIINEERELKKLADDAKYQSGVDYILNLEGSGGTNASKLASAIAYIDKNFEGTKRSTLRSAASSMYGPKGGEVEDTTGAYESARMLAATQPEEFMKLNLHEKYFHKMSKANLNKLVDLKAEMWKSANSEGDSSPVVSLITKSMSAAAEAGVPFDKDKPSTFPAHRRFMSALQRDIDAANSKLGPGKKITPSEEDDIIKRHVQKHLIQNSRIGESKSVIPFVPGRGRNKTWPEVRDTKDAPTWLPMLPDADSEEYAEIKAAMEAESEPLVAGGKLPISDFTMRLFLRTNPNYGGLPMTGALKRELENEYKRLGVTILENSR